MTVNSLNIDIVLSSQLNTIHTSGYWAFYDVINGNNATRMKPPFLQQEDGLRMEVGASSSLLDIGTGKT